MTSGLTSVTNAERGRASLLDYASAYFEHGSPQHLLAAHWLETGQLPALAEDDGTAELQSASDLYDQVAGLQQQIQGHLTTITRQAETIRKTEGLIQKFRADHRLDKDRIAELEQQLRDPGRLTFSKRLATLLEETTEGWPDIDWSQAKDVVRPDGRRLVTEATGDQWLERSPFAAKFDRIGHGGSVKPESIVARCTECEIDFTHHDAYDAHTAAVHEPAPWTPKVGDRVTVTGCLAGDTKHLGQTGVIVGPDGAPGTWLVKLAGGNHAGLTCSATAFEPAETAEPAGHPGDGSWCPVIVESASGMDVACGAEMPCSEHRADHRHPLNPDSYTLRD